MHCEKIAFVILHYQNVEVTFKCIEYLLCLENIYNNTIIIVDNDSPNHSGNLLKVKYNLCNNIKVIINEKNLGFAGGNNIGYRYAIEMLHSEFVIIMNSDVFIKDKQFITSVLKYYNLHNTVGIVAPDIIQKNGFHQNPYLERALNDNKQKQLILRKKIGRFLYGIPLVGRKLIHRRSVDKYSWINNKEKQLDAKKNIIPHGACLIYMPEWTRKENIAFVEGTFLFVEEELLFDYCVYRGMDIVYEPSFVVYHIEDASQDAVNESMIAKKRKQIMYEIQSRKLLLAKRKKYRKSVGEKWNN